MHKTEKYIFCMPNITTWASQLYFETAKMNIAQHKHNYVQNE